VGVSPVVILAAVLYFVIVFGIGLCTRKAAISASDYMVGGRRVGAVVNGAALASSYLSPATFLGMPAFVFLLGYPFWWAMCGIIAGMPLASMLTAAPLRKYAPISFTDYYADRYEDQKTMRILVGLPTLFAGLAYVVLALVGTGLFMMAILHIPYFWAVVLATGAVMFYVYLGGMVATTWSNAFQGLMMTVAAVVCAIAILTHYGGFIGLGEAINTNNPNFWLAPHNPEGFSHPLMATWTGMIGFYFVWHFGFAAMPYTVVRFFTSMDVKSARRSVFWAVVFGGIMYWGLMIIGAAARVVIETLHPLMREAGVTDAVSLLAKIKEIYAVGGVAVTDYSMIAAIEALRSPILLGVLVAGGLAIAMSTAAGWVMVLNVLIGRDWMGNVFGSKWAIENPIKSLRLWTIVILVAGALLAFKPLALVLDLSGWAFVTIISTVGAPLILGLWWRRSTKAATYATIITFFPLTLCSWLYAKYHLGSPHWFFLSSEENLIATAHQVYWVPVSFIFFIIVSLLTKPPKDETIKKYCDDLH